MIFERIL